MTITIFATDTTALDTAARKIMASVKEAAEVYIQVLPVSNTAAGRFYNRKITVIDPTDKTVNALVRVDVPKNISISVR